MKDKGQIDYPREKLPLKSPALLRLKKIEKLYEDK